MGFAHESGRKHMGKLADRSPRLAGLALIGMGLAFLGLNAAFLYFSETYYPSTLLISGGVIGCGIWVAITGRAHRPNTPQPVWWHVGAIATSVVGIGAGALLSWWVGK